MDESSPPASGSEAPEAGASSPEPGDVRRARRLARLLDDAVGVPGTGLRVGVDPLLGLVPGLGDVLGALLAGALVVVAARRGAPPSLLVRMLANLALDELVGSVPVLGDVFDAAFKANRRNLRLLEDHVADPTARRRGSRLVMVGAGVGVLAVAGALALALAWTVGGVLSLF